jgi:HD-GYP domain-containing protein (c-di-GMP phosphodiesterase class II)
MVVLAMLLLTVLMAYQFSTSARQAIHVLADTIDAKSPYTGEHCERVPQLVEALMQGLCDAREGPFAEVSMTEAEIYECRLGACLHDCGKVTSPEHIVPWGARRPPVEAGNPANRWSFDMVLPPQEAHLGELHNLAVRRGTLTAEDRFKINDHIVQAITMLSDLPFPPHLSRVPSIAGSHHEKLDGTGYPRRLKGDELTLADRVMTLADIFEALTASDRPYKPAKTLSESIGIMANMVRNQHIGAEVFRFFLHSGVWRDYAQRFLVAAQRDTVDLDAIERLMDASPVAA